MTKKKTKYYLWYDRRNGELYAYTHEKEWAIIFDILRDENQFIRKEKMLTSDELLEIHEEAPDTLLVQYNFKIEKGSLFMPITMREKLTIESMMAHAGIKLNLLATVYDVDLFTEEVQKDLSNIYYTFFQKLEEEPHIQESALKCFVIEYGDTLKKKG